MSTAGQSFLISVQWLLSPAYIIIAWRLSFFMCVCACACINALNVHFVQLEDEGVWSGFTVCVSKWSLGVLTHSIKHLAILFQPWNLSVSAGKNMVNILCVCVCLPVCVCLCQGLFRIAAGASKLKKLKAALDCSTSQLEEFYSDPHAVAGTSPFWVFSCMTRPFCL